MEAGRLGSPSALMPVWGLPGERSCGLIALLRVALPHLILHAPKLGTMALVLCGGTENTDCLEGGPGLLMSQLTDSSGLCSRRLHLQFSASVHLGLALTELGSVGSVSPTRE